MTARGKRLANILADPALDILSALPEEERAMARKLIIELVLATDLARHFDFISSLNSLPPGPLRPSERPEPSLCLTLAIKCADLGHSVKRWELHREWTRRVTDEFYALGDRERAAGLPISTFCDRHKDTNLAKSQVGRPRSPAQREAGGRF